MSSESQILIFEDRELEEESVVRFFRTTAADGKQYENDRELLRHAGQVSAELAKAHAEREFIKFRRIDDRNLESDFDRAVIGLPPQKEGP